LVTQRFAEFENDQTKLIIAIVDELTLLIRELQHYWLPHSFPMIR
jgi:hypothetical protein